MQLIHQLPPRFLLAALLIALLSLTALAQDETDPAEEDAVTIGSAPTVLSITPETATVEGGVGTVDVLVRYDDVDIDAVAFIWSMVDTNLLFYTLPVGYFDQFTMGTEIPVTFTCAAPGTYADMTVVVEDVYGNQSEPAPFSLVCAEAAADMPIPDAAAEVDAAAPAVVSGTAPEIVSITPDPAVIAGPGEIEVTVVYADADEDAASFTWTLIDSTNLLEYELPGGTFSQAVTGTEIAVNFFCTQPDFRAEVALTVGDEAGNFSEPVSFDLVCE